MNLLVDGLALGLVLLPVLDVLDDPALRLRARPRCEGRPIVVHAVLRGRHDRRHRNREDQGYALHFGREVQTVCEIGFIMVTFRPSLWSRRRCT